MFDCNTASHLEHMMLIETLEKLNRILTKQNSVYNINSNDKNKSYSPWSSSPFDSLIPPPPPSTTTFPLIAPPVNSLFGPVGSPIKKTPPNHHEINLTKTSRLHVSNIPFRYRREHLARMFSYFGDIIDSEVIFNERGSKGFGFVSFARVDDAERAKRAFDGIIIDQRKIEVNYATPKPRKTKRSTSSSTTG